MLFSVIVSTYNSPRWLEKVLTGYAQQTDRDFEIVIADDGSGPETRALVERFAAASEVPIRHVWQPDQGFRKNMILNKAIVESKGDYLVFTDGDCIPRADFLSTHRSMSKPGRFLSGGYCRLPIKTSEAITSEDIVSQRCFNTGWLRRHGYAPTFNWQKILARPWSLDGLLNALTPAKPTFNGNNSSCFRRDAMAAGGFDERMGYGGEDREFGYRLVNNGIMPKIIRYSALCLHLDHPRNYQNAASRAANEAIIADTKKVRRTRTEHGLHEAA